MNDVKFRFSPDIFIRLGEELNPSPSNGIIELIRNSYDANATSCEVKFNYWNYKNIIQIIDNGDGMSLDDIQNGWFILGKSKKVKEKTRLGRIPVGDKGLGRLAALRLGKEVKIITQNLDTPHIQYSFNIDWSKYESAETIDQIDIRIDQSESNKPPGTEITISDVTVNFGRDEISKLAREMVLLADPFGGDPLGFEPILKSSKYPDIENLVLHRYFDHAEFILNLDVDDEGRGSVTVTDYRSNKLFEGTHEDIKSDKEVYRCPKFNFQLWIYILDNSKFVGRIVKLGQVRQWLNEFGGVHIYQNNIRVAPYGDKGNDWLELNLLRARSPELMPSTNTSIGKVSIYNNELLIQKTDRTGFIENTAFNDIKKA